MKRVTQLVSLNPVRIYQSNDGIFVLAQSHIPPKSCSLANSSAEWVKTNVLPTLVEIPVTHKTYDELLAAFAEFYLANKADANIVVHMGYIVEAKVLRDMFEHGYIGAWDGPYPLYDVSGNLQAAGADPTSVDKFASEHNLQVGEFEGGTHNPLYDAAVAAVVYRHLTSN